MINKALIDTNILVYAYDLTDPKKQEDAFEILDKLAISRRGIISSQILAEFFVAVTRKINNPLDVLSAQKSIENFISAWTVLDVTDLIVLEAIRGVKEHKFSYWDAQIWATAKLNQIPFILSEDFNIGGTIEGITFMNPFSHDFKLRFNLA